MFKTKQELFDAVVKHAQTMTEKSVTGDLSAYCKYRNSKGNRCFIGALIPDSEYKEEMEGKSVQNSIVAKAAGIDESLLRFAFRLQNIHDFSPIETWVGAFEDVAKREQLTFDKESYKQNEEAQSLQGS